MVDTVVTLWLTQSYFCHFVNFQVTCWDLTPILFSSVRGLWCYLLPSYSSLIFDTVSTIFILFEILRVLFLSLCQLSGYFWDLTPISYSSQRELWFYLLGSYTHLIFVTVSTRRSLVEILLEFSSLRELMLLARILLSSLRQASGYLFRSYSTLIFINKGTVLLLAQILLLDFCHSDYQGNYVFLSDITSV